MTSHVQPLAVRNYYNTAFKEVHIHYLEILIQTATPLFKKYFFHYFATKKNVSNFSQVFDNCSHSKNSEKAPFWRTRPGKEKT